MTTTQSAAAKAAAEWRLNVLGSVELRFGARLVDVVGVTRNLLALLARTPGEEVASASLITGLWGTDPPEDAEKTLASHVSRLRKALTVAAPDADPTGVIVATPSGYILAVSPAYADVRVFERLLAEGRRALAVGQPALAVSRLDEALRLWRGPAYADVGDQAFARTEAQRLDDLRLAAVESRMDARLAVSAPIASASLVSELQSLVVEHWHRERLWVQLMTALYRLGRQTEALSVYRHACTRLAEGLNIEPGPELRAAERAVSSRETALHGMPVTATAVPEALTATVPVCVGREEEIEWLLDALDMAATRRGQARLIAGSSGIGKTRLVGEVAQRAAERGVILRYGRGGVGGLALPEADRLSLVIVDDLDSASSEELAGVASFVADCMSRPVLVLVTCRDHLKMGELSSLPKLVLTALDDRAVAEIVRVYAPSTTVATASSAIGNAAGIPARVHRAAGEWAFARAGRRIDRAVAEAAEPARWMASIRAEIVAAVLDLAHVRAQARPLRPATRGVMGCPYRGLRGFDTADATLFHGRERLIAELVSRLVSARLLAIVGDSGTGKSSLIRAGLIPALGAGILPDSAQWSHYLATPVTFDAAMAVPPGETSTGMVVVDQFETAFTALDAQQRDSLVDTLLQATTRCIVVIAVRSDFYPRCAEHPQLACLMAANTVLVPPMSTAEVREVIEAPALAAELRLEDGLVDALVTDAQSAPAGLASLSAALVLAWERRSGRRMTLAAYRSRGGVVSGGLGNAVEAWGERAYVALRSEVERDSARQILVRLADARVRDRVVARRVPKAEFDHLDEAAPTIDGLASHEVITVVDGMVEVVHESLLTHWPRVQAWLDDEVSDDALRRHLATAATSWIGRERSPELLYRGARLAATLDWVQAHPGELTDAERQFVAAGQRVALAHEARRRAQVVRLRKWLAGVVAVLVAAVGGVVLAVVHQQQAAARTTRADAGRLAALALAEPDLRRSMLLAVAATRLDPATSGAVRSVLLRSPDLIATAGDQVTALALSPDSSVLAAGTASGTVVLYNASLAIIARLEQPGLGSVDGLAFTPDGHRLMSWGAGADGPAQAGVMVWDVAVAQPAGPPFGQVWPATTGGLLADGGTLLLAQPAATSPPKPGPVVAWSVQARTPSTAYELPASTTGGMAISPDGRLVAFGTASGAEVVDLTGGDRLEVPGARRPSSISPDGHTLLSLDGGDVLLWSIDEARRAGTVHHQVVGGGASTGALGTAWSADGRSFATYGSDGNVVVWDARNLRALHTFAVDLGRGVRADDSPGGVRAVRFSTDGATLFTASGSGAVLAWDLSGDRGVAGRAGDADPAQLVHLACEVAGRDLTEPEWHALLPGYPYQHVCLS